jgi:hypothetical protein
MHDSNGATIPIETSIKLWSVNLDDPPFRQQYYQALMGSLMYAILGMWLDLAYSILTLSRFNSHLTKKYHGTAK